MNHKTLWMGLLAMAMIVPIGVVLPQIFGAEGAWGEWSAETLGRMLGFVPEGLRRYGEIYKAPVGDYSVVGSGETTAVRSLSYVISGLIGGVVVGAAAYIVSTVIQRAAARRAKQR